MRLGGQRESNNVEDRRGEGSGGLGGMGGRPIGLGGGGIPLRGKSLVVLAAIVGIGWLVFGINPIQMLAMMTGGGSIDSGYDQSTPSPRTSSSANNAGAEDPGRIFVAKVLGSTEDVWTDIFKAEGETYTPTPLVLFSGATRSACGSASAASGPFYCPVDKKVYIDLAFYDELKNRFGASGDFAQAYVIAHEVGHHVQDLTGVLPKFNQMRQQMSPADANAMSVKVELQADCYAGVWANKTDQKGMLEEGDIDEALNAATQIGDDAIQKRSQGYVVPDSFTHGTSAQRSGWFKRGYQTGDIRQCNTFAGGA
ncbi:zinc metallopeptidase [Kaistia dalseonensis]|uniref:Metalloprotease n=1 Tax=Kaistia dalseonensis TaxID=410840 RepID=A0ABU0HC75_9HYPH|nr:neutral zinc metallopeptidase [Kaistia dalseonensis]MCX5497276.1 zinc metallopeptidase [Kaistia dalseonensis]MDQ0439912.1 putative metalloprotease [Kaistia dalseonensis]